MRASEFIIGQEHALRALQGALSSGRLAHCYVFAGAEGTGKRTLALALAKSLQCETGRSRGDEALGEPEFCGECPACRQIEARCHPDVLVWADRPRVAWWSSGRSPRIYSGPLAMEEARQLREEMSLTPTLGSRKMVIIDQADEMDTEPANSLLKTLEEPPGQRIIILLVENPGRLLPTILSRAEVVRFGLVSDEVIHRWLASVIPGVEDESVWRAVTFAGGRPGWAHFFALNPGILEAMEGALQALVGLPSGDPYAVFWTPGILQAAAREWQRLRGDGESGKGLPASDDEEEPADAGSGEGQVARECLPPLLNAVLASLRHITLSGQSEVECRKGWELPEHLDAAFYAGLVPPVEKLLKRLAANVNVTLLLQVFCLEVAALGRKHSPEDVRAGK
jgi:DNA polymerase III delta' subunit